MELSKKSNLYYFKLLSVVFLCFFFINAASAFTVEKNLIQTEVDPNYPCFIINNNIICEPLESNQLDKWTNYFDAVASGTLDETDYVGYEFKEEIDEKPVEEIIVDDDSIVYGQRLGDIKEDIMQKKVPFEIRTKTGITHKTIDPTEPYVEYFDLSDYNHGDKIKIGFASNVFAVSGTPMENFNVNVTSGKVQYQPYNRTWIDFNGTTDYIIVPFTQNLNFSRNNKYAISIWFKGKPGFGQFLPRLVDQGGNIGFLISINANSSVIQAPFNFTNGTGSIQSGATTSPIIADRWYHLVTQFNGSQAQLYINAVINGTTNINANLSSNSNPLYIGCNSGCGSSGSRAFNGSIDEIRIYNSSLSTTEIQEIYNSGTYRNTSLPTQNLSLWYPMNAGRGSVMFDWSPYGSNGTLGNGTWTNDTIFVQNLGYQVNISITNMSNSLVFWDNYTLINQSQHGSRTFTFFDNQSLFILDNYNIVEGSPIENTPIIMSKPTTSQRILTSSLDAAINTSVNVSVTSCDIVGSVGYSSMTNPAWTCNSATNTLSFRTLNINPGQNTLTINYVVVSQSACNSLIGVFLTYPVLIGLIGTFFLIGLVILIFKGITVLKPGAEVSKEDVMVFFITLVAIGVLLIVSLVMFTSLCSLGA